MKKLSPKEKIKQNNLRLKRRNKWNDLRIKRRNKKLQNTDYSNSEKREYNPIVERYKYKCIDAPVVSSIEENTEEFSKFNEATYHYRLDEKEFRKKYKISQYDKIAIDLTNTEKISPAFALNLASQLSLVMKNSKTKFYGSFVKRWRRHIQLTLRDLGFFKLLRVKIPRNRRSRKTEFSIVEFEEFHHSRGLKLVDKGNATKQFLSKLKELTDKDEPGFVPEGIGEAMINVTDHAYDDEGYFWITAFFREDRKTIWIILCDKGQGIPTSMRNSKEWKERLPLISNMADDNLLEEACSAQSRTKEPYRGQGIQKMIEVIKNSNRAEDSLRIYSGKACAKYHNKELNVEKLNFEFDGTLIEWKYKIR